MKPGAVGAKRPALGRLLLEHVVQIRLEHAGVDSGAPNHRSGGHRPRLWPVRYGLRLKRRGIEPRALWVERDAHRVFTGALLTLEGRQGTGYLRFPNCLDTLMSFPSFPKNKTPRALRNARLTSLAQQRHVSLGTAL